LFIENLRNSLFVWLSANFEVYSNGIPRKLRKLRVKVYVRVHVNLDECATVMTHFVNNEVIRQ
jgi:hypothetical protein